MRKTKIVCTIGPATSSPNMLRKLIRAGMAVARLNFSHGTREHHTDTIAEIRKAAAELDRPVAVLQDLSGPKVRIGAVADGSVLLEPGQCFVLTSRNVPGNAKEVSLTYKGLPRDVRKGDRLLLSDGALELIVEKTTEKDIHCRVAVGGPLSSGKGVNVPDRSISVAFPTDKDRKDLVFGLRHHVDYVALSFVRNANDVKRVRAITKRAGKDVPLIAKIEKHEALNHMDEIIAAADGIMIARGDLGVEMPIEQVPRIQKVLIDKTNQSGKPVITATQMLKSMVENPRPTRAEVTDVANAILDGSDAVMLSEETAVGKYPVAAVRMMARIAGETETYFPFSAWSVRVAKAVKLDTQEAVAQSASQLAERVRAAAIVTCTQSGSTTRLVAKYRPSTPILAFTPDERTYRQLALVWGAVPLRMAPADTAEGMERQALGLAGKHGYLKKGDIAVITAGLPLHVPGTTNMIKAITV